MERRRKLTQLKLKRIHHWHKEYEWLSNNYQSPIIYGGDVYPSVSHAFLASKTEDQYHRMFIAKQTLSQLDEVAITAPRNWHGSTVMKELMEIKFGYFPSGDPEYFDIPMRLQKKLLQTGSATLVYGNNDHDMYYGQCLCNKGDCLNYLGKNLLGHTIMVVRNKLNERLKLFGGANDWCFCGEPATNIIHYSIGWVPYLKSYCDDPECVTRTMGVIQELSSDGIAFSWPVEGTVQMEMPPLQESKPVNEIIPPKVETVKVATVTDDDDVCFDGWDCSGVGMWNRASTVKEERKFETIVIQGK